MLERRPPSPATRERRVLFVGRLCAAKNLRFWLDVARRVAAEDPGIRFDIAGDGELRAALAGEAERRGLAGRLEFHGFVPHEQLGALYSRASAFLLTSHSEGLGRVLLEALAHEVPVVAPRITGPEDVVVDGRSGYLVEPRDEGMFAGRILALLRDPALGRRLGAWGGADVRARFDPARLARRWVDLLVAHAA
jgi:glycosyltransferase involved in cell wall biosynthesis